MKHELPQTSRSTPVLDFEVASASAVANANHDATADAATDAAADATTKRNTIAHSDRAGVSVNPGAAEPWHSKNRRMIAGLIIFAVAAAAAGIIAWQHFAPKPADKSAKSLAVLTVALVPTKLQNVDDNVTVTGSITAWDPLTIGSEVSGLRIQSVNVEEGDVVKKGVILARLNSGILQAQLRQAQARLLSSKANYKKSIQPNRPEEILGLKAALQQTQANVAQGHALLEEKLVNRKDAKVNAHRYAALAKQGAVSTQEAEGKLVAASAADEQVHNAQAAYEAAVSAVDQARQKLLEAQRGGRAEDVEVSRATLQEIEGQIEQLREQIKQSVITAPDDGVISGRTAHIGDIATAGQPLFSMIRHNRLELRAQVPDQSLSKFAVGQKVSVSSSEDGVAANVGTVWLVSPQVDPATRLGVVRVQLPAGAGFKPGMFVRGEVKLGARNALTVPVDSVVTRNSQSYVYSVNENSRVVSVPVKLGVQTDTFAEIKEGLVAGQQVVGKGARFLSDQDVVRVIK